MPMSLNGRSTWGTIKPHTPFCPWRDANLSPSSGRRTWRVIILIRNCSFSFDDIRTLSTYEGALDRYDMPEYL